MSRKSRLRKQAKQAGRVTRPPGRPSVTLTAPAQKPLPNLIVLDGSRYSWGHGPDDDHALQRLQERGIGVFEVYAALLEPDFTLPASKHHPDRTMFIRGDLGVVLEKDGRTIVTVVDRLNGTRLSPRVALAPPRAPIDDSDSPLPERQSPMSTAKSKDVNNDTDNGASNAAEWAATVQSAPIAVAHWVADRKPGDRFTVGELVKLCEGNLNLTDTAIRSQILYWTSRRYLTRIERGHYKVNPVGVAHARNLLGLEELSPAQAGNPLDSAVDDQQHAATDETAPVTSQPIEQVPEPIQPATPLVLRSTKSTMQLRLTADWSEPPPRQSGLGAIADAVRYHVLDSVATQLKERPGRWMRILEIEGGANPMDLALKRINAFRKDNPYPQLEMVARPIVAGQTAGVWARWVDKPATSKNKRDTTKENSAG